MEPEVLDGAAQEVFQGVKLESVNMVLIRGVSIAQAARDLDINENVLSRWIREFKQIEQQAFPGHGIQKPDDAEVTRLRREVAQLKMERDILKKPQPSLPRIRREVQLHSKAPRGLAGWIVMRGARCLEKRFLRLDHAT